MTNLNDIPISEVDPYALDIDRHRDVMPKSSKQLAAEEDRRLDASIRERGQEEPCEIYDNAVLDGRRRVLACRALGIQCRVRVWPPGSFASKREIAARIMEIQSRRRNIDTQEFNRLLAIEAKQSRHKGQRREDFVRDKSKELSRPPKAIKDSVRRGQQILRLAPGVLEIINRICTAPDSIIGRMCLLDHKSQQEVIKSCDSERSMKSEIERRLDAKTEADFKDRLQTPPEPDEEFGAAGVPTTQHEALTFSIQNNIEQVIRMLVILCQTHETPAAKDTLGLLEQARKRFMEARQS